MHSPTQFAASVPLPPPRAWFVVVILLALGLPSNHNAHVPISMTVSSSDTWRPPLPDATETDVVRPFVAPERPWSAAHRGVDLRTGSTEVVAPAPGEVTFIGTVVDRPVVTIRHSDGLFSSFEPVTSDLQVGQIVSQGDPIGDISAENNHCGSACLHWGVRKPDAWQIGSTVRDLYLDPAFLLGWTEPSVLWPLHSEPAP